MTQNRAPKNQGYSEVDCPPGSVGFALNLFDDNPRVAPSADREWAMTDGELRFYLREIHTYWTTPRIASERVNELRLAKLIECSIEGVPMIRLTGDGEKVKLASRLRKTSSTLSLVRKLDSPRRGGRGRLPPPKPFV